MSKSSSCPPPRQLRCYIYHYTFDGDLEVRAMPRSRPASHPVSLAGAPWQRSVTLLCDGTISAVPPGSSTCRTATRGRPHREASPAKPHPRTAGCSGTPSTGERLAGLLGPRPKRNGIDHPPAWLDRAVRRRHDIPMRSRRVMDPETCLALMPLRGVARVVGGHFILLGGPHGPVHRWDETSGAMCGEAVSATCSD